MLVGGGSNARRRWALLAASLVLAVASLRVHAGLRSVPVPFTDESVYASAFWEERGGAAAGAPRDERLYPRFYAAIARSGGEDPRAAHRGLRLAASTLSGLALFAVLLGLPGVSLPGALVASLLWAQNLANTPPIQHGNLNVLAFALGALGLAAALSGRTGRAAPRLSALLLASLAAWCRIEYALFLAFLLAREAWRAGRLPRGRRLLAGAALLLLVPVVVFRGPLARTIAWVDGYLWTGLRQCYSAHATSNAADDGDPMVESDAFARDFPGDATFRDAILRHPLPLARYLATNGAANALLLPRRITSHHGLLAGHDYLLASPRPGDLLLRAQSWGLTLFLWVGAAAALAALFRAGAAEKVALLLVSAFAATALVAVLLLVPTPRYWLAFAVFPYWGGAWLASRASEHLRTPVVAAALALAAVLLAQPAFPGRVPPGGREEQDRLLSAIAENARSVAQEKGAPVTLAGYWPSAPLAYLPPLPVTAVNLWSLPTRSWRENLEAGRFDLLLRDDALERSNAFRSARTRPLARYEEVATFRLPESGEMRLLKRLP